MNDSWNVLVTGGAGFIGSHIVNAILQNEDFSSCHIVVVDDLSGGFLENVPVNDRVTFRQGDVSDAEFVSKLFTTYRFRFVYHLAAYAAEGLSHFIRAFNYTNNLIASMHVLNQAVKQECECFVFTSSIAVYGAAQTPMTEETVPQPEDPYGIAKYAVELDLKAAHEMFGLNSVVFRPHNVYGEYQNIGDRYRNVVGIFMNQILKNEPMTVFGDGKQQRAFTYIGEIAPAIASAPFVKAAQNQTFNVGADRPYTVNELAKEVATAMGRDDHPVNFLAARNEVTLAFSDHSRSHEVFGGNAEISLKVGLTRMAQWVHRVGARESKVFGEIEIEKNLPPSWRV